MTGCDCGLEVKGLGMGRKETGGGGRGMKQGVEHGFDIKFSVSLDQELLTGASCRKDWERISAESSPMSPRRSNRSRD